MFIDYLYKTLYAGIPIAALVALIRIKQDVWICLSVGALAYFFFLDALAWNQITTQLKLIAAVQVNVRVSFFMYAIDVVAISASVFALGISLRQMEFRLKYLLMCSAVALYSLLVIVFWLLLMTGWVAVEDLREAISMAWTPDLKYIAYLTFPFYSMILLVSVCLIHLVIKDASRIEVAWALFPVLATLAAAVYGTFGPHRAGWLNLWWWVPFVALLLSFVIWYRRKRNANSKDKTAQALLSDSDTNVSHDDPGGDKQLPTSKSTGERSK